MLLQRWAIGAMEKNDYADWCVTGMVKGVVYMDRCVTGEVYMQSDEGGSVMNTLCYRRGRHVGVVKEVGHANRSGKREKVDE